MAPLAFGASRDIRRRMNRPQKTVVLIGVAVVIAMLLFPPWQKTSRGYNIGSMYQPRQNIPPVMASCSIHHHPPLSP